MIDMHRRYFLASGTALLSVVIAGCGHPSVVLDMDTATADDIADEVSITAELGSEEHTLVTSARENGSATRNGRYDLFDRTDTIRIDDTFYEVSETRLESSEETIYEVHIDFNPDDPTPELGEIEYVELPEVKYHGDKPQGFTVLSVRPRRRTDAGEFNSPRTSVRGRLEVIPEHSMCP